MKRILVTVLFSFLATSAHATTSLSCKPLEGTGEIQARIDGDTVELAMEGFEGPILYKKSGQAASRLDLFEFDRANSTRYTPTVNSFGMMAVLKLQVGSDIKLSLVDLSSSGFSYLKTMNLVCSQK